MKRVSLFALAWLLVLGAVYGLIRAAQVYAYFWDHLCGGLHFCGETVGEFLSARVANIGRPSGWSIRGPLLAVLLGVIAAFVIAWARSTPKTVHLTPLLFGASGRTDRKGFWIALLFWTVTVSLIMGIIQIVDMLFPLQQYYTINEAGGAIEAWMGAPSWIREPEKWVLFLWTIGGLISMVMVSMRRVHDRGRNAWWLIPMYVLSPWAIIELGFLPGSEGANSYGPVKSKEDWN